MKKKIIVVDDHDAIRKGIKILLESISYDVCEASNGNQALALLENEKVNLAIIDLMMPEMDGFTLCDELKKKHPDLPVIILTAKADAKTESKVKSQLKPDRFLTKPIDNQMLIKVVQEIIH